MKAADALARLIEDSQDPGATARVLAVVTQARPLLVRVRQGGTIIGPLSLAGVTSVAVGDQVLLELVSESNSYVCLGRVTAA
jgi:hypothetical protein